jgi:prepilin-type N-terminal cleavage/methylation domain-containing protein
MRKPAFTIIELLVVLIIIGLLLAAAAVGLGNARKGARDARRIGDILLISKAIDQYAYVNRGTYPTDTPTPNATKMCAGDIDNLDLSAFPKNSIPVDPHPFKLAGCDNMEDGYIYRIPHKGFAYSLEVGLEGNKPTDEPNFKTAAELNENLMVNSKRQRYFLLGPAK